MIDSILDKIKIPKIPAIQSWSAITLQGLILYANVVLFRQGRGSSFILTSSALILSLFSLQVVSRRFTLLYPINTFMNRITVKADTCILRCFISLSIFFLILGVVQMGCIETYWAYPLYVVIPFLVPILPFIWHFRWDKCIRQNIVKELKKHPLKYTDRCHKCGVIAKFTKSVIEQNRGKIQIECEKCGKYHQIVRISIGY